MMIGYNKFVAMLNKAVEQIQANHPALSKLDSFGGDGDHGTTMLRAMTCLQKAVKDTSSGSLSELLTNIGWAVMGVDGGATGPLLGSLFSGMADKAPADNRVDARVLAEMFDAGRSNLFTLTQARVGDKTLVDAVVPAIDAMQSAAAAGKDIPDVLAAAARAAANGTDATKTMQPRFGRAKNLGAAAVGHPDAGATSVSLLFKGFVEGVGSNA